MPRLAQSFRSYFIAFVLAGCVPHFHVRNPEPDPALAADRSRWATLQVDPNSVPRSTSDPYPGLWTDRRMKAAEACGVRDYWWRMPDMLRVIFDEGASSEAIRNAAELVGGRFLVRTGDQTFVLWLYPTRECTAAPAATRLRALPGVTLVSTLDLMSFRP